MATEIITLRVAISALVLTIVCSPVMACNQQTNLGGLSDADKAEIVESALRLAFGNKRSEFELPKNLSSENIEFIELSRITRLGFVLLDASRMRSLKASQFVDCVVFRRIVLMNGIVLVVLARVTQLQDPCVGSGFYREQSFAYEFHNDSGEWIGQLVKRPAFQPSLSRTLFRKL